VGRVEDGVIGKILAMLSLIVNTGQLGLGTVFGSSRWDPHNPNSHLACTHREIDDKALVVAHNTLPCRAKVWVMNPRTGRSVLAQVMDRGPRHALVDMSRAVARKIRHNGREPVLLVPMEPDLATELAGLFW
jgi:rare lipoprotein A (peptidoglycan hydrolase)